MSLGEGVRLGNWLVSLCETAALAGEPRKNWLVSL